MSSKRKKIIPAIIAIVSMLVLAGCSAQMTSQNNQAAYERISAEAAKNLMDTEDKYIIIDARTQSEYDEGHIQGAILIPDNEIKERAEAEIMNKNQLILVYCRSGRRSKIASEILADLGYTNVKDFGGIIDWDYEIVQ